MRYRCFQIVVVLLLCVPTMWGADSAETSAQISFRGRVVDAQGQPIAGARVSRYQFHYSPEGQRGELVDEQTTGADGAFLFSAPRESDSYRFCSLIARKEGLAMGWAAWQMREGDQKSEIVLGPPEDLAGRVVDEHSGPIADATVSVALAIIGTEEDRKYLTGWGAPDLIKTTTDAEGRFVFPGMPGEATFEFTVSKPGRATVCTFDPSLYREGKLHFSPGQADIELTLPPEARLKGVVVTKTSGEPVPGVAVMAQPDQRTLPLPPDRIVSAADGTFSIGGLAAGGYSVQLASPGEGMAEWVAAPAHVSVQAGQEAGDVKLEVSRGGFLEVLVKDDEGRPIEGARLSVREPSSQRYHSAASDANGIARTRLMPGPYELSHVYKEGYTREQSTESFEITEGQTTQFERTLNDMPSITGIVCDTDGNRLQGVDVRVMPSGSRGAPPSDAEGRFKASWDPAHWRSETVFCVVARDKDRNLAVAEPIDGDGSHIELKLLPAATLTGSVVDVNGAGIEGANLRIMLRLSNWGSSLGSGRDVSTGPDGTFEVPAIPPGQRYGLTAMADGYGQCHVDLEENDVTSGRVDAGRFMLPVANLSVSGAIVDSEGKPVPGARVYCYGRSDSSQPDRDTQADAEGKFALDGVCAGRIHISANARTEGVYRYGSVETEGGARDVQIVVAERSTGRAYVPKKPKSLKGKELPDLEVFGVTCSAEAEGRRVLVCFADIQQRPSRHCVTQLIRQASQLRDRNVLAVVVQASAIEEGALKAWAEKSEVTLPVGRITEDIDDTRFNWGVESLPHLILTDTDHKVVAEGFSPRELDEKMGATPAP